MMLDALAAVAACKLRALVALGVSVAIVALIVVATLT